MILPGILTICFIINIHTGKMHETLISVMVKLTKEVKFDIKVFLNLG